MSEPPAILFDTVDSRSSDVVADQSRPAGVAYYDTATKQIIIPPYDVVSGEAYTAYSGGKFRFVKENKTDSLTAGDEVVFSTNGYLTGSGSMFVCLDSPSGERYAYAELNPVQALLPSGGVRQVEQVTVTNHGLASIAEPVPVMFDSEAGSPTENQYVLATKPLQGAGDRNDSDLRGLSFFAVSVVDANTLGCWHVAHATSLGEQTYSGAAFTPDQIAWLQDDGTVGYTIGSNFVRLWRTNTATKLDFHADVIAVANSGVQSGSGYRWYSTEFDINQDIVATTDISLNATTAPYTTLRDAGTAYLSHSTANNYLSDWFVEIDGQTLSQDDFTVTDGTTIRLSRLIQATATSAMVVWTQVEEV